MGAEVGKVEVKEEEEEVEVEVEVEEEEVEEVEEGEAEEEENLNCSVLFQQASYDVESGTRQARPYLQCVLHRNGGPDDPLLEARQGLQRPAGERRARAGADHDGGDLRSGVRAEAERAEAVHHGGERRRLAPARPAREPGAYTCPLFSST